MAETTLYYTSPVGIIRVRGGDNGVTSLIFVDDEAESSGNHTCVKNCILQLGEYFDGTRRNFAVRIDPGGTSFQKRVWLALQSIEYGATTSYLLLSESLGDAKAIRAVGSANGRNPISIIIPCHRVIGSDGSLTGYAGGLWRKQWLLEHEGALQQNTLFR
jgi:methylated-DNA-[protein]-cysteine S-methyltransferase